jgi:hypothetical protein
MNPSVLAAGQSPHSAEPSVGRRLLARVGYYVPSLLVMLALLVIWQRGQGAVKWRLPWTANTFLRGPGR